VKSVALSASTIARSLLATLCLFSLICPLLEANDASLLPSANEFRLTLAEDLHSTLPLGPSCTGEAAQTLTCRAFELTLENLSKETVRISWAGCSEAQIHIDRKEPKSSREWVPVSQVKPGNCWPMSWASLRLRPGEKDAQSLRLISSHRYFEAFEPGLYTLRAQWALLGCTEEVEGEDCLSPLQAVRPPNPASAFAFQKPVFVTSNEVTVEAPVLPALGVLKISFEVSARRGPPPGTEFARKSAACIGDANYSIDCIVFHYAIHNFGDRPLRYVGTTCTGVNITPEYRTPAGKWEPVPGFSGLEHDWMCVSNGNFERPILPGGTSEGDFVLPSLPLGYDVTVLRAAADYLLRFTYSPRACFASPDGSFCLTKPEEVAPVLSPEVSIPPPATSR
jgi:hypothetical protein